MTYIFQMSSIKKIVSDALLRWGIYTNVAHSVDAKKFHIIVFWCQMNYSDSARIKSVLQNCGMQYVDDISEADIVIFDTCSVRQKSEDKVTGKLQEIDPNQKVWITGCMIQHNLRNAKIAAWTKNKKVRGLMTAGNFVWDVQTKNPSIMGRTNAEIKEGLKNDTIDPDSIIYVNHAFNPMFFNISSTYTNVELFFRIDDTGFLPLMLEKLGYDIKPDVELFNEYNAIIPEWTNQLMQNNTKTAFVPISTWCSQFCAFCIVPYARGLEKHLPVEQVVKEAKHHIDNGIEEITLLGQIVNKHPDFVEICKQILALPWNLKWLRYTSPYPTYYSDELLELHEKEERFCPHIHMPLQSGSTKVLKKMFRGYNREEFIEFVDKIHALKRPISITTDIIVWFTDETDEDYLESLSMMEYAKFDMVYIGIYSVRPGTFAARKYEDNVDKKVKHARWDKMNELLKTISIKNNEAELWTIREIMVNKIDSGFFAGYADNMKNVIVREWNQKFVVSDNHIIESNAPKWKTWGLTAITVWSQEVKLWDFVKVRILWWGAFKLEAELLSE